MEVRVVPVCEHRGTRRYLVYSNMVSGIGQERTFE